MSRIRIGILFNQVSCMQIKGSFTRTASFKYRTARCLRLQGLTVSDFSQLVVGCRQRHSSTTVACSRRANLIIYSPFKSGNFSHVQRSTRILNDLIYINYKIKQGKIRRNDSRRGEAMAQHWDSND